MTVDVPAFDSSGNIYLNVIDTTVDDGYLLSLTSEGSYRWRIELPGGTGTQGCPIVDEADNLLLVFTYSGPIALDLDTGTIVWDKMTPDGHPEVIIGDFQSSSLYKDGIFYVIGTPFPYVYGAPYKIWGFYANNGTEKFNHELRKFLKGFYAWGERLITSDNKIYLTEDTGYILRLRAEDGAEEWYGDISPENRWGGHGGIIIDENNVLYVGADTKIKAYEDLPSLTTETFSWFKFHKDYSNSGFQRINTRAEGTLNWKKSIGVTRSSPVIGSDDVYIADLNNKIYAFNKASGDEKWVYKGTDGYYSTPTYDSDNLYAYGNSGIIVKLNKRNSSVEEYIDWEGDNKIYSSGFVYNDRLIIPFGRYMDAFPLINWDDFYWEFDTGSMGSLSSPLFDPVENQLYILDRSADNTAYLYSAPNVDGDLYNWTELIEYVEWTYNDDTVTIDADFYNNYTDGNIPDPIMDNEKIYYSVLDTNHNLFTYAVYKNNGSLAWKRQDYDKGGNLAENDDTLYLINYPNLRAIYKSNGTQKWETEVANSSFMTLAVTNNYVYVSAGGDLYSINKNTGAEEAHYGLELVSTHLLG